MGGNAGDEANVTGRLALLRPRDTVMPDLPARFAWLILAPGRRRVASLLRIMTRLP